MIEYEYRVNKGVGAVEKPLCSAASVLLGENCSFCRGGSVDGDDEERGR